MLSSLSIDKSVLSRVEFFVVAGRGKLLTILVVVALHHLRKLSTANFVDIAERSTNKRRKIDAEHGANVAFRR
ncbi:hypothetical protein PsorP6_007423 [Peronosclerospora sorghi]|uniref:Uncharacterized protein n=1 Tax=Peronosclerospora sorghi TaxID=230839 RepID=A0ACC0WAE6_9STRA|nr:hypothetical protein PsorP6_007423 [Peronosclerospora sorghi]